jgi:Transposase protein
MARGLCSKWKTPVFIGFDTNFTKDLKIQIVGQLHEASYDVVSCVSDMGSATWGFGSNWKFHT